ncbi:YceI-like domain-containing protein [Flavobacteriaceae bacterium MAR_2010_72]|nr:YceI-like domain-containing protein [Flavobacteriaceae bacterium MAR_2010_72]
MKRIKLTKFRTAFVLIFLAFSFNVSLSQDFKLNNLKSTLSVFGTSSLHDWEVKATNLKGAITLTTSEELQIQKLYIEVLAESLKSGKNAMDKNTYKALKTVEFKTITFQLAKIQETSKIQDNVFNIKVIGDLTIAGVTKRIPISFKLQLNDNTLILIGEKDLEMTDYGIEPPKALFGTITTGNKISIKFNTVMAKS